VTYPYPLIGKLAASLRASVYPDAWRSWQDAAAPLRWLRRPHGNGQIDPRDPIAPLDVAAWGLIESASDWFVRSAWRGSRARWVCGSWPGLKCLVGVGASENVRSFFVPAPWGRSRTRARPRLRLTRPDGQRALAPHGAVPVPARNSLFGWMLQGRRLPSPVLQRLKQIRRGKPHALIGVLPCDQDALAFIHDDNIRQALTLAVILPMDCMRGPVNSPPEAGSIRHPRWH
jgi:hypothetical protein